MREHGRPRPRPRGLTRRQALGAGAGAAALGLLGGAPASAAAARAGGVGGPREVARSTARSLLFLRAMTDAYPDANGRGPVLAQSYSDQNGLFSTAFVYDEALSICAALSAGRPGLQLARRLGDGLLFAQQNDPVHDDGRLRQAYDVGPYVFYDGVPQPYGLVRPDGTANVGARFGFLGTAVGDMAWPGMALAQLHERTRERRFLDGALRIGRWILTRARNPGTLGGFSFGVDAADARVPNVSTEHNIDCVGFFEQLAAATGDTAWQREADVARDLVESMWEPSGGFFYTGSNDGSTINRSPLPLDPQTWGWLSLQDPRFERSLEWAASTLATTDDAGQELSQLPDGVRVSGVTFSSASLVTTAVYESGPANPQGVWLEGTGQLATAFGDRGRPDDLRRAADLLAQVRVARSRVGQGQTAGGRPLPPDAGVVAATSALDTGFGFGYFQSQHIGATSWYLMAVRRANAFRPGGLV